MAYKKIIRKPKKTIRLNSFFKGIDSINDDMVASVNSAKECYNFDTSTGALTPLSGFSEQTIKAFTGFWLVAENSGYVSSYGEKFSTVVFVDYNGRLMSYDVDEYGTVGDLFEAPEGSFCFTSKPQMIEYKRDGTNVMLFCSATDGLVSWAGGTSEPKQIDSAPPITSMAKHSERLFVTVADKKDKVWFSDVLDPTNWTVSLDEAGYIGFTDERGDCEKLLSFGGYVYVFRSYGISRITAYGDQTEFVVEHVFSSGSKIYPSTITLCANRIIFASDDGIFSFNGSSVTRILPHLSPLLKFGDFTASAYYKGKFYLATKMYLPTKIGCETTTHVNNVMLAYDFYNDKYNVYRGVDIRGIYPIRSIDKLYFIIGNGLRVSVSNNSNTFNGELLERKWKSPESDFGSSDKKLFKELSVCTDYDITVKVYGDEGSVERYVKGKQGRTLVPINLNSHTFSVEFISNDYNCRIASPTITYY